MTNAPVPAPRLPSQGDSIPVRETPVVAEARPPLFRSSPLTFAIIAANVAVFAAQIAVGGLSGIAGMSSRVLHAFGGNDFSVTVFGDRYETLLTSCFVHASLLHIAFNMIALRQIGPFVERSVGVARMAPLYLLSGIAGSLGSAFFGWQSGEQRLSVGASGAICGLVGAALVIGYRVEGSRSPLMRAMAGWLASIFGMGIIVSFLLKLGGGHGGFDNAAHAGGAIAGASIAAAWRRGEAYSRATSIWIVVLCTCITIGMGFRVARFTLTSRFATMGVEERVAYAVRAIDQGNCPEARAALESLHKLAPDTPQVQLIDKNYRFRCTLFKP